MNDIFYLFLALFSGIVIAIYIPMNSQLSKYLHSPIATNIIFFFGALLASTIIFLLFGNIHDIGAMTKVPPYLLLTGIAGAIMILLASILVSKLGANKVFILLVSGQLIMAIIVSHFGLFGTPKDPITIRKTFGAIIVIIGSIIAILK